MRRKMILALMLAIVSSVWMTSEATCLTQAPDELYWSYITVRGTIQWLDSPCEEGEECPPCVTPAIVTSDKTYYLSSSNQEVRDFLDHMETAPIPAIYLLPLQARASGTPYTQGSFDFLVVSNINELYVQYFSDQLTRLPSLCDEWNVLHEPFECMGPYCYLETDIYRLKGDTGISIFIDMPVIYYKLEKNGQYIGALHEGNNRDIYYVPANSQNAYLLYAFNAQVGDELENVWLGGETEKKDCTNAHNATVIAISDSNPRIFTLEIIPFTSYEGMEVYPYWMEWIEGVGMSDGPVGAYDSNKLCPSAADLGVFTLLCAYKDGEQVYSSPKAQKYGCEFNGYYVEEHPSDTIPLFVQDDPGSSTVDPVDPNQLVATLKGNQLTIHENMGTDITYTLQRNAPAQAPAIHNAPKSDTFRDEVTIQITESGEYLLQLTNPSWDYIIYGQFYYAPQGIETLHPASAPQKVLIDGQIYILRGDIVYTIDGREVK